MYYTLSLLTDHFLNFFQPSIFPNYLDPVSDFELLRELVTNLNTSTPRAISHTCPLVVEMDIEHSGFKQFFSYDMI